MPTHHVMLSYQWNVQALVEKVYQGLRHLGINAWMDTHGGITGNINDRLGEIEVICMPLRPILSFIINTITVNVIAIIIIKSYAPINVKPLGGGGGGRPGKGGEFDSNHRPVVEFF